MTITSPAGLHGFHRPVRTHQKHVPLKVNVGRAERIASIATGVGLLLAGSDQKTAIKVPLVLAGGMLAFRGITGYCPIYGTLGLNSRFDGINSTSVPYDRGISFERSITVNKPPDQLYGFWRRIENLPRFMGHLESVTPLSERRSHWVALGPAGRRIEWEAEIINDIENQLIGWRSLENSDVDHAGSVHFEPAASGGTDLRVIMRFDPPAGAVGAAVARLFGESPEQQIEHDLRHFKELMERETPTI